MMPLKIWSTLWILVMVSRIKSKMSVTRTNGYKILVFKKKTRSQYTNRVDVNIIERAECFKLLAIVVYNLLNIFMAVNMYVMST